MFSGFSTWLESASDTLQGISEKGAELVRSTGLLELDERYNDPESGPLATTPAEPTTSAPITLKELREPPSEWSSSSAEWVFLITAAFSDPNMCASRPADLPSSNREQLDAMLQHSEVDKEDQTAASSAKLPPVTGEYEPTPELLVWFQAEEELLRAYSAAVPEFISERNFWNSLGWRLCVFRLFREPAALLEAFRLCTTTVADSEDATEEAETQDDTSDAPPYECPLHTASEENEYWARVTAQWEQLQAKEQRISEQVAATTTELDAASGNLKLLVNLVAKGDVSSALAQSVVESCEYHKVKLTRQLASVIDQQDELRGSVLDMHSGELYPQLMKANDDLERVLAQVDAIARGGVAAAPAATAPPEASHSTQEGTDDAQDAGIPASSSTLHETPQLPASSAPAKPEPTSTVEHPAQEVAGDSSPAPEDTSFEVTLPWDLDE